MSTLKPQRHTEEGGKEEQEDRKMKENEGGVASIRRDLLVRSYFRKVLYQGGPADISNLFSYIL